MGSPAVKNRWWSRHGELFTKLGKTKNSPGLMGSCGGGAADERKNGGAH
jgi:hypothetical protein